MADIKNLSVLPRPRSAWQAMDAGFSLARAHYIKLVILWLGFALPAFALTTVVQLWTGWSFIWFFWWWFKPLYELPLLMYISKALFSEKLSLVAAWKLALSHLGLLFRTYLSVARLSSARALTYGVVFLEALPRKQRNPRIQTLTMVPTRHYVLMLVCLHVEYILAYALIVIFVLLFASHLLQGIDWVAFFNSTETDAYQPWFLAAGATGVIAGALVAPFYITGGFLIYINRRMSLEAWDIEHRFRSIVPRSNIALALVLVVGLVLGTSDQSLAEDRAQHITSSEATTATMQKILAHEDFGIVKTRKIPKFDSDDEDDQDSQFLKDLQDWMSSATGSMAKFIKIMLWIVAALFLLLLIHTLRSFRRPTLPSKPLTRSNKDEAGVSSHPMTQNLPDDITGTARRLLDSGERRQALSVLFRGALRAVMDQYDMKINKGATESDCKDRIETVASEHQIATFSKLLGVWQKEAYANQPQQEQLISGLISDWTGAFSVAARSRDLPAGESS